MAIKISIQAAHEQVNPSDLLQMSHTWTGKGLSVDGIGTGNIVNGGMTNMNVVMDGNSGKWLMHTSTS